MSTTLFRRYLINLRDRNKMMLQVMEHSGHEGEKTFHFAVELLDDIIHHYDIIVNDEPELDIGKEA